ncbi:hypothetical protein CDL15_Pgr012780 [Punica granatum]|uniref:Uncharacterized protein n=1 Tax=Punica granatum TaxID=22663 RepID=A0A218XF32_PUNGR|nr:hypothetical protein CDL15_Pgr012780 [Punica granatum]
MAICSLMLPLLRVEEEVEEAVEDSGYGPELRLQGSCKVQVPSRDLQKKESRRKK